MSITPKFPLFIVMIGLLLPVSELQAGSATQEINFTATFYGGSCNISAPSQVIFNNGDPISNDMILNNQQSSTLVLTVSDCTGYFMAPRIEISGNTMIADDKVRLYADASSTTKGYGVRLSTLGNNAFTSNPNTATPGLENRRVYAKDWPEMGSSDVASLNGPLTFNAALACGTCTPGPKLYGGVLTATVTFSFLYN